MSARKISGNNPLFLTITELFHLLEQAPVKQALGHFLLSLCYDLVFHGIITFEPDSDGTPNIRFDPKKLHESIEFWKSLWQEHRFISQKGIDELRSLSYQEYLKSTHWISTRYGALERAGRRCQLCNTDKNLQVHHRTYERLGCELWVDLFVVCDGCHKRHHNIFAKPPASRREE